MGWFEDGCGKIVLYASCILEESSQVERVIKVLLNVDSALMMLLFIMEPWCIYARQELLQFDG